jgi:hypothetical protein
MTCSVMLRGLVHLYFRAEACASVGPAALSV